MHQFQGVTEAISHNELISYRLELRQVFRLDTGHGVMECVMYECHVVWTTFAIFRYAERCLYWAMYTLSDCNLTVLIIWSPDMCELMNRFCIFPYKAHATCVNFHINLFYRIILSTPFAVLSYFLIWYVPSVDQGKVIWYLIFYCLFQTLQTVCIIQCCSFAFNLTVLLCVVSEN